MPNLNGRTPKRCNKACLPRPRNKQLGADRGTEYLGAFTNEL